MYAEIVLPIPLDKAFSYNVPPEYENRICVGQRVTIPFGKRQTIGYVYNIVDKQGSTEWKTITSLYSTELVLTPDLLKLSEWLALHYACSLGEAMSAVLPLKLRAPKRVVKKKPGDTIEQPRIEVPDFVLTEEQQTAINVIKTDIEKNKPTVFLLHGVAASGKTEIYFKLIEHLMSQGKQTIYLLPEISLTPQFIELTQKRFGIDKLGVWHSRLSASERYHTFLRAARNEIQIMLGARSAVFAPFKNLGMIIIDEEHEFTYKQDMKPFYHTREVAIKRANLTNSTVILGSATPALETRFFAEHGRYTLIELRERVAQLKPAPVQFVDLRNKPYAVTSISTELKTAIENSLKLKQQIILFINRRGFSTTMICRSCGYIAKCPHCGISLVYHRTEDNLQCHFCRYNERVPLKCPWCNGLRLNFAGAGTEKVESEITKFFPLARIKRMDLDTTTKKTVYSQMYHAFKNEQLDILIGTQMIAKGFDFPNVTLVGIINADTTLHIPDFRSAERTFQLLTQVAGRAGRSEAGGLVILQTYHPDLYVFKAIADHSYEEFYKQELELRKQFGYPPFNHLTRIIFRHNNEDRVKEVSSDFTKKIRNVLSIFGFTNTISLLGPAPAPYLKIRDKFRWQLLLKGDEQQLDKVIQTLRTNPTRLGVQIIYDIDPVDML